MISLSKYDKIKLRIHQILEPAKDGDRFSKYCDIFILSLIFLNLIDVIFQTHNKINSNFGLFLKIFETVSIYIFCIEYILRIWSANSEKEYNHPFWGRLKFALRPIMIIDLLAISPFFLPTVFVFDLRILRAVRLLRIIRVLKITRYHNAFDTITKAIKSRKEQLILSMTVIFVVLMIASTFVYYFESQVQPQVFSSIPETLYWGIITMTTVGYGDAYPITPWGKFFTAVISLMCVGFFAIPSGILSSALIKETEVEATEKSYQANYCPHCGKSFKIIGD